MEQMMNFKRMEVTGATKEEALAKAPFEVLGDATQSYRAWRKTMVDGVTESDKKQFMVNYLNKKVKDLTGVGFYITVESAIADTRQRPWKLIDIKNENGPRKFKLGYLLIDKTTGTILGIIKGKKVEAKSAMKKLYEEQGFRGKIEAKAVKMIVDGEDRAFEAEYAPSKNSRIGTYVVFGTERNN